MLTLSIILIYCKYKKGADPSADSSEDGNNVSIDIPRDNRQGRESPASGSAAGSSPDSESSLLNQPPFGYQNVNNQNVNIGAKHFHTVTT